MAKKRDSLIVASKVKAYIKSKKMMMSSDALQATSEAVYSMLDAAIARTQANRRSTVKPQDLQFVTASALNAEVEYSLIVKLGTVPESGMAHLLYRVLGRKISEQAEFLMFIVHQEDMEVFSINRARSFLKQSPFLADIMYRHSMFQLKTEGCKLRVVRFSPKTSSVLKFFCG